MKISVSDQLILVRVVTDLGLIFHYTPPLKRKIYKNVLKLFKVRKKRKKTSKSFDVIDNDDAKLFFRNGLPTLFPAGTIVRDSSSFIVNFEQIAHTV